MFFRKKQSPTNEVQSSGNVRRLSLRIKDMHCGSCASSIEHAVKRQKGVIKAKIDYSKGVGTILYDPDIVNKEQIIANPIFKEPSQFVAEIVDDQQLGKEEV